MSCTPIRILWQAEYGTGSNLLLERLCSLHALLPFIIQTFKELNVSVASPNITTEHYFSVSEDGLQIL